MITNWKKTNNWLPLFVSSLFKCIFNWIICLYYFIYRFCVKCRNRKWNEMCRIDDITVKWMKIKCIFVVNDFTWYLCFADSLSCIDLVTIRFCFWIVPIWFSNITANFLVTSFSTLISLFTISAAIFFSSFAEKLKIETEKNNFSSHSISFNWLLIGIDYLFIHESMKRDWNT